MWITNSKILVICITVFGKGFRQQLLCYVVVRITYYKKITCFISWARRCYRIRCKKIMKNCNKIICFIRKLQCDVVMWITHSKILIIFITVFGEGIGQRLLCYIVVRITHYKKIACFISWVRRFYRKAVRKLRKCIRKLHVLLENCSAML